MIAHFLTVVPLRVEPVPQPRTYEKPSLLPGLWVEGIKGSFADAISKLPPDTTITEMTDVLVLDYAAYVNGLLQRLKETVRQKNLWVSSGSGSLPSE